MLIDITGKTSICFFCKKKIACFEKAEKKVCKARGGEKIDEKITEKNSFIKKYPIVILF